MFSSCHANLIKHLIVASPFAISSLYHHFNYFRAAAGPVEPSINHSRPFRNWRSQDIATKIICKRRGGQSELGNLSKCPLKVSLGCRRCEKNPTLHCWGSSEGKEQEWDVIFAGNSKASQAAAKGSALNFKCVHRGTAGLQTENRDGNTISFEALGNLIKYLWWSNDQIFFFSQCW